MVICLICDISDGFSVGLACFLVVFVIFGVFEALSITRSAIDGLNSIVLENDAAVASVRKKIIIFIFFNVLSNVLLFIKRCGLVPAYIGARSLALPNHIFLLRMSSGKISHLELSKIPILNSRL